MLWLVDMVKDSILWGKVSKNKLACKNAVTYLLYGSCSLRVMDSCICLNEGVDIQMDVTYGRFCQNKNFLCAQIFVTHGIPLRTFCVCKSSTNTNTQKYKNLFGQARSSSLDLRDKKFKQG